MHKNEAAWLFEKLRKVPSEALSPTLNIGSSTQEFRQKRQPWIHESLIGPLENRGVRIIHSDIKDGVGIDVRADILDDEDLNNLMSLGAKCVLCCNMMEHVLSPQSLARKCWELVATGGYIVVTVPYSYPHHRDPIDTMFRPTPAEISTLFTNIEVIEKEIIEVGSYRDHMRERPLIIFRHVFRFPFPFIHFSRWQRSMKKLYWLTHPYLQSCVIMKKVAPQQSTD